MARRTDHPLKTVFLLVCVAGLAWAAYHFLYVKGLLRPNHQREDAQQVIDKVYDSVPRAYAKDDCFVQLGGVNYRQNEARFRVSVTVSYGCLPDAHAFCKDLAQYIHGIVKDDVSVFAYTEAGAPVAQYIE